LVNEWIQLMSDAATQLTSELLQRVQKSAEPESTGGPQSTVVKTRSNRGQ
jgi:hypothetical protein